MSAPLRVRQIDHITIVVRNLERSRRFYVDALGMEPAERPAFRFPGLWFRAGETYVHLIEEHPESGPAGVSREPGCLISRTQHFAFAVDDALAARDHLVKLGYSLADGPKQRPDGPTQIYLLDPDGYLVELFSN